MGGKLTHKQIEDLAHKLLDDLDDRSGFSIDDELRRIIQPDWVYILYAALEGHIEK